MISIQNLSVEFNSTALFSGVNFVINKRDKIALVGKNGAGKSTMLKPDSRNRQAVSSPRKKTLQSAISRSK